MNQASCRHAGVLTLLAAMLVSPARSMPPATPPLPSPQAFKAADILVGALKIIPRLHNDCDYRLAVATEAATRLATSNFSERIADDNETYVAIIAGAVRPLITEKMIDKLSNDIKIQTSVDLANRFVDEHDIASISAFFTTPAGEKLSAEFIRSSHLATGQAGYLVYRALQPKAKEIQEDALLQYRLTKAGRPTLTSIKCH